MGASAGKEGKNGWKKRKRGGEEKIKQYGRRGSNPCSLRYSSLSRTP